MTIFVLATLPAGVLVSRLERYGIQADAVGGSIWSGRVQGLTARGALIGDARWTLSPVAMLRGALAGHAVLVTGQGHVETDFERSWSGLLRFSQLKADLPLDALAALRLPMGRGWRGQLTADLDRLELDEQWPVSAAGVVELHELVAAPPSSAALGSFRLAVAEQAPATDGLRASLTQTDGPLLLDGNLRLGPDRSFLLEGRLAPRGTPTRELAGLLQALGPPEADGRRPFSVSGTF